MMIGESEWIKEYSILNFNFGLNHKCVRRDTISKMESGVIISFLDLKMKILEPNQIRSV